VMPPATVIDETKKPPGGTAFDDNNQPYPLDPKNHPYMVHRLCRPRQVTLAHSGAFAKYVGRLDIVLSNVAADLPVGYDPTDGFEVVSTKYQVFPINDDTPEDPYVKTLLEPYQLQLETLKDVTTIAGFSPNGAKRTAPANGDSALGNLVASSNWLRLGVQTDFALTNTTGLRQDLLPGPVTIDEAYDIFPFDNTITTMSLSGAEVFQLYDFVARRSAQRGCVSQAQVAGSRVRINCNGCTRTLDAQGNVNIDTCHADSDCPPVETLGTCNTNGPHVIDKMGTDYGFACNYPACAETAFVGFTTPILPAGITSCPATPPLPPGCCLSDADCTDSHQVPLGPESCSKQPNGVTGICMNPVVKTNVYALATSNYLAAGGSGFRVLQRNTTQINSGINQRDAMLDYIRQGKPCGWGNPKAITTVDPVQGLTPCMSDNDCQPDPSKPNLGTGGFVCACAGASQVTGTGATLTCSSGTCPNGADGKPSGRCVLQTCRDQVAQYHVRRCAGSTGDGGVDCLNEIKPCDASSEICQLVACVDDKLNAVTDNRIQMRH
jgi:5'-nucleotidase/UDP-sugar diphosphatase